MDASPAIELIKAFIGEIAPIIAAVASALLALRNGRLIKGVDIHVESRLSRLEWLVMRVRQRLGEYGGEDQQRPDGDQGDRRG